MASQRDVGRPLKFQSVEELQQKIDAYFAECDPHRIMKLVQTKLKGGGYSIQEVERLSEQVPYTVTGLALALDTTRRTLLDYESGEYHTSDASEELKAELTHTIKKAKLKIHNFAENKLFGGQIVAGIIFNLKNNHGWVDRQELTGVDGSPVNLGPEAALALDNILGEMKNGKASGSGSHATGLPESGESTDVQPDIHESHPEEPAATA